MGPGHLGPVCQQLAYMEANIQTRFRSKVLISFFRGLLGILLLHEQTDGLSCWLQAHLEEADLPTHCEKLPPEGVHCLQAGFG